MSNQFPLPTEYLTTLRERIVAQFNREELRLQRQRAIFLRGALVLATALAIVALLLFARASDREQEAERLRRVALTQLVVTESTVVLDRTNDSELATLLAIEGVRLNSGSGGNMDWLVDSNLRAHLATHRYFNTTLAGYQDWVSSVAFSPDGRTLASAGRDLQSQEYTIHLWDLGDPAAAPTLLAGHQAAVRLVAFSPDGRTLAGGSADGTIRLWDVGNPAAAPTLLAGYQDWVNSVAFSPDGRTLASAGRDLSGDLQRKDYTIRLWDLGDPAAAPTLLVGHPDWFNTVAHPRQFLELAALRRVSSLAFSPDGRTLASATYDGTIRLWPLLEELVEIGCQKVRRNLSWAEWQRYLPGEPYRQTCSNLPLHPSVLAEQP